MLFTYTSTEQTEEVIKQVNLLTRETAARCNKHIPWSKSDSGFLFSFDSSWCRELATNQLLGVIGPMPPGKLNIYGIRKHSECWSNQPRDTVGEIGKPDRWVNTLFTNLFEFMTEMFSYILETEQPTKSHTLDYWLDRLARNSGHICSVDSKYPVGKPEWLLNLDTDTIPDTPLWKTNTMFGTMYNIPSEWVKCPAIMSYLLYLPRVWGAFYESDNILAGLGKLGRLRYNGESLARMCGEIKTRETYRTGGPLELWRQIAKRLMLPLWFTNYGRQDFWIFTYLIIREGLAMKEGLPRIPGFQEALITMDCSGFISLLRHYKCKSKYDAPNWVKDLHDAMQESGPFAIIKNKPTVSYV